MEPVSSLDPLPAWANVDAWTVERWELAMRLRPDAVLNRYAYRIPDDSREWVDVPGFAPMELHRIAALVQRTREDPDAGRSRLLVALTGWLDSKSHRRHRLAWRIRESYREHARSIHRARVQAHVELGHRLVTADPYQPVSPPEPNAPR